MICAGQDFFTGLSHFIVEDIFRQCSIDTVRGQRFNRCLIREYYLGPNMIPAGANFLEKKELHWGKQSVLFCCSLASIIDCCDLS